MSLKIITKKQLLKKISSEALVIFDIFGDNIRLVGGCVRDLLLKKSVHDYDFATNFLPQEVISILKQHKIKAILTGEKFGTITAVINNKNFEITTLRKDSKTDGRHAEVEFVDDYFEDAKRRDFTINALYLDKNGNIHDYFGGLQDLNLRKLRFIGDANLRINEDYLRILRFFRFSLQYADKFDKIALEACVKNQKYLRNLSRERIRQEFFKIVDSKEKLKIIKILKIFNKTLISDNLFSKKLNIALIKRLFSLEDKLDFNSSFLLKLSLLFIDKDNDLEIFFKEICATRFEKKYFLNLQQNIILKKNNLKLKTIKILLVNFDKEFVTDLFLFSLVNNFTFIRKTNDVKNIISYINNFSLPEFSITAQDLIKIGIANNNLSKSLQLAKNIWAQKDFKPSKNQLLQRLINIYDLK